MAKKKATWQWVRVPGKAAVPDSAKAEALAAVGGLIDGFLKPTYIKAPKGDERFNYLIDIRGKWRGSYLSLIGTYACPDPESPEPTFDLPFARMEYAGGGRFNLAYMRHTGKWWELFRGYALDEAIQAMRGMVHFHPA